jgi:hypothetical protein
MRTILALAGAALAVASTSLGAKDEILVLRPTFDRSALLSQAVRRCAIADLLDQQLALELERTVPGQLRRLGDPDVGIVLKIRVTEVFGSSGGAWSGEKGIALRAELLDGGRLLQSEEFSRRGSGGAAGLVSGTCPVFRDIAHDLGENVAAWLGRVISTKGKER